MGRGSGGGVLTYWYGLECQENFSAFGPGESFSGQEGQEMFVMISLIQFVVG